MKEENQNGIGGEKGYRLLASAKRTIGGEINLSTSHESSNSSTNKRAKMTNQNSQATQLAPIFRRGNTSSSSSDLNHNGTNSSMVFKWRKPLGLDGTCLYAEYGKPFEREVEARKTSSSNVKVACFDLDGCLIRPKDGRTWPSATDAMDFEQAFRGTFERVKREYEQGACIAIVTNQDQSHANPRRIEVWKTKMKNIAQAIDCPMVVFAATSKDGFRKPGRSIWDHGIVQAYKTAGGRVEDIEIDANKPISEQDSFFVGDAAGRVGDHSDTDRKWATNVGLPFFTPEEFFYSQKPKAYKLSGWRPTLHDAKDEKGTLPSNFFAISSDSKDKLDLILFVGPPAAGKTSFFKEFFADRGYVWVNQDTLKTASRCHSTARTNLKKCKSVVVDNTNRNVATRLPYINIAKELGNVQIRCVFFDISEELSWHNNLFRVRAGLQPVDEPRTLLPRLAFSSYFKNLEKPKREEGFDADIIVVEWSFRGGEEAKRRWLQQWE